MVDEWGTVAVDVEVDQRDLFDLDLGRDLIWRERGPLLVIGNPPWVTNSELGTLASAHRPPRRNIKGLRGLEARTGSSNFDVAEAIWLKLAFELADERPTIALLCKTAVARSVLQFTHSAGLPIATGVDSPDRRGPLVWRGRRRVLVLCHARQQSGSPPRGGGVRGGPAHCNAFERDVPPTEALDRSTLPPSGGGVRGGGPGALQPSNAPSRVPDRRSQRAPSASSHDESPCPNTTGRTETCGQAIGRGQEPANKAGSGPRDRRQVFNRAARSQHPCAYPSTRI